jgi:hypothetical protein
MAAPTKTAKREESSCQLGAVHTWHLADALKHLLLGPPSGTKRTLSAEAEPFR